MRRTDLVPDGMDGDHTAACPAVVRVQRTAVSGIYATEHNGCAEHDSAKVVRRMCYVTGPPGSGKSSLLRAYTELVYARCERSTAPVAHLNCYLSRTTQGRPDAVLLGDDHALFPGTDQYLPDEQQRVLHYLRQQAAPLVLAEGLRCAYDGWFHAVEALGYDLMVVTLDAPDALLAERRAARGFELHDAWTRARTVKARRIGWRWAVDRWDATLPTEALVERLLALTGQQRQEAAA